MDLRTVAQTALSECLALKPGERFLVVSNPGTEQALIAEALHEAAQALGIHSTLLFQGVKTQTDYAEDYVLDAISSVPDAIASLSTEKLGKDRHHIAAPLKAPDGKSYDHIFNYLLHGSRQLRAFWSPGMSIDTFSRTVAIDYALMRSRAKALRLLLDKADAVRVTSPGGTDILVPLRGRSAYSDDGDFTLPGKGGNLPAGEVFISPQVKSAEGIIVFDGSVADIKGDILIKTPITCNLLGGFVMECSGGEEAERLEKALRHGMDMAAGLTKKGMDPEEALRYAVNARHLGEFGIGLNAEARISGNMLEDEKVYGTCHFAIGFNYDEDAPAMIHLDGLVKSPTITAILPGKEEVALMSEGLLSPGLFSYGE
jgi:leucyl aminopeptidase (aminopeptidase T)